MNNFIIKNGRKFLELECEKCNISFLRRSDIIKNNSQYCFKCTKKLTAYSKHSDSKTKLYSHWANMKNRCYGNATQKNRDYKKKGIIICNEWKNDFLKFKNWALENGYKNGLSIDRINNNGNYEPDNCRWVDVFIQNQNQREISSSNKSGYKNISFLSRDKKWVVQINRYNKKICNKGFKTLDEAILYRDLILKDINEI